MAESESEAAVRPSLYSNLHLLTASRGRSEKKSPIQTRRNQQEQLCVCACVTRFVVGCALMTTSALEVRSFFLDRSTASGAAGFGGRGGALSCAGEAWSGPVMGEAIM